MTVLKVAQSYYKAPHETFQLNLHYMFSAVSFMNLVL